MDIQGRPGLSRQGRAGVGTASQCILGLGRASQSRPWQGRLEHGRPGRSRPVQSRAEQCRSGVAGQASACQVKAGQGRPG
jgi:hypothetical protein